MKALKKYLKSREDTINILLLKPSWTYSSLTFHKLRVEIKKLNALFELINYCEKDFKRKKSFEPFKKIFAQAGKVRELQIEEAMLKKFFQNNLLMEYRNNLKKERLTEQQKFFLITNKEFTERLKRKYREVIPFISEVNKNKLDSYMEWQRNEIDKLLSKSTLQIPQVHTLRILLKTIYYNRESLGLNKQNKEYKKNDNLSVLLGQWHDCEVILRHLNKAKETGKINPAELGEFKTIEEKFSACKELLFKKINEALPSSEFTKSKFPILIE